MLALTAQGLDCCVPPGSVNKHGDCHGSPFLSHYHQLSLFSMMGLWGIHVSDDIINYFTIPFLATGYSRGQPHGAQSSATVIRKFSSAWRGQETELSSTRD